MARHLTRPSATRCAGAAPLCPRSDDQPNRGAAPAGDGTCTSLIGRRNELHHISSDRRCRTCRDRRLTSGSHRAQDAPVSVGGLVGSANSARTRAATRARSPPRQPMPAMPERPTGVTLGSAGLLEGSRRLGCGQRKQLWMTDSEIVGEAARFPAGEPRAPRGTEDATSHSGTGIGDASGPRRRPGIRLDRRPTTGDGPVFPRPSWSECSRRPDDRGRLSPRTADGWRSVGPAGPR